MDGLRSMVYGLTLRKYLHHACERHAAETHDDFRAEQFDLAFEIRPAVIELLRGRFVIRRRAAGRSRDVHVPQSQAVLSTRRLRLTGKAGAVKRGEKKIA